MSDWDILPYPRIHVEERYEFTYVRGRGRGLKCVSSGLFDNSSDELTTTCIGLFWSISESGCFDA